MHLSWLSSCGRQRVRSNSYHSFIASFLPRRGHQQNICNGGVLLFKKYSWSVVVSNYLNSLMYVSSIKRHCPFLWGTSNCEGSSPALEGPSCWPQRALEFGALGHTIWLPEHSALDLSLGAADAYIVGIVSSACLSNSIWPFVTVTDFVLEDATALLTSVSLFLSSSSPSPWCRNRCA